MWLNIFAETARAVPDKVAGAEFYHGGNAIGQAKLGIAQDIARTERAPADGASKRGREPGNGLQAAALAVHAGNGGHKGAGVCVQR